MIVDAIRSYADGFIFTTSLPPALAAGAVASIRWLKEHNEVRVAPPGARRDAEGAASIEAGLPVMPSVSHIVPVLVGDAGPLQDDLATCCWTTTASTSSRSTIRPCRAAPSACASRPTPFHTDEMMDDLVAALEKLWVHCNIQRVGGVAA